MGVDSPDGNVAKDIVSDLIPLNDGITILYNQQSLFIVFIYFVAVDCWKSFVLNFHSCLSIKSD